MIINLRIVLTVAGALLFVAGSIVGGARPSGPTAASGEDLVGVWACQSISGGQGTGRPCRMEPWLRLTADHKYEWGREQGDWKLEDHTLTLSKRKGKGHLNADGKLIFEYELHGTQYVLTLYRRQQ